jgi:protein O-mannosyl-transferase
MLIAVLVALLAHPNYGALLEHGFAIRSLKDNLLTQANGVAYLLSRVFVINGLNIDPDLPVLTSCTWSVAAMTAVLAATILAGVMSLRKIPWIGFGLLWFFVHLLPTNSSVPREDVSNDRQLYLPLWASACSQAQAQRYFGAVPRREKGLLEPEL